MARAVHRSGLVALGIATALMASCAFAAKDVVVAVGSNFTTLDPYDANDTLSQAVAKSFYQGLFGLVKVMKLKLVLAESYTVSDDGITYTVTLREEIPGWHRFQRRGGESESGPGQRSGESS